MSLEVCWRRHFEDFGCHDAQVFFLMVLLLGLVYLFGLLFTQLLDGKNQPPGEAVLLRCTRPCIPPSLVTDCIMLIFNGSSIAHRSLSFQPLQSYPISIIPDHRKVSTHIYPKSFRRRRLLGLRQLQNPAAIDEYPAVGGRSPGPVQPGGGCRCHPPAVAWPSGDSPPEM